MDIDGMTKSMKSSNRRVTQSKAQSSDSYWNAKFNSCSVKSVAFSVKTEF